MEQDVVNNGGRIAVVTGATSGIGEATARRFAQRGFHVVATGRRESRLAELESDLATATKRILGIAADVGEPRLIDKLFDTAVRAWGRDPDIFVLSAGHGLRGTILYSDVTEWSRLFEINCLAALRQMRDCAARFVAAAEAESVRKVRDLIIIGSTIGRNVSAFNPVYGATKFAVHSAVEALRQEICCLNIRVSLVEPGFVKSEFQARAGYDKEWFQSLEAEQGPFLIPDDVAAAIDFSINLPSHVHIDDIRIRPVRQKV